MIFTTFDPNEDIVTGQENRVSSGIWPNNNMAASQSLMVCDFFSLTGSVGNPSYGTSKYDIRRTMYYLNVFPTTNELNNNDPYFSIAYGNIGGNLGSGSFTSDVTTTQAHPTKAIYTEYVNMLLGDTPNTSFIMKTGNTVVSANDIWAIAFSAYKMNDNVDAGAIQFSLKSPTGQTFTFIDDSPYTNTVQTSYQIISGSINSLPTSPNYQGLGLFFPASGVIILNAAAMAALLGFNSSNGVGSGYPGSGTGGTWPYNPLISSNPDYAFNHMTLFQSMISANVPMYSQKSEFVPSIQYYIRVKNKQFNYSNNPTYVYSGTDGIHSQGLIYNSDFITNPRTYITTVGLYNDSNELIAVAKLSRPLLKSFNNESLIKVLINT